MEGKMAREQKSPRETELVHESMQERSRVAGYLRAVADGLEAGRLRLSSGERRLELHPPTLCSLELRATTERQRVKLRLQVSWREPDRGEGGELEISGA